MVRDPFAWIDAMRRNPFNTQCRHGKMYNCTLTLSAGWGGTRYRMQPPAYYDYPSLAHMWVDYCQWPLGKHSIVLKYEDFLEEPQQTIHDVLDFLGVPVGNATPPTISTVPSRVTFMTSTEGFKTSQTKWQSHAHLRDYNCHTRNALWGVINATAHHFNYTHVHC